MSPHGAVIWLLAAATWVALGALGWLLQRFRRPPVPCITSAALPGYPADPADLTEYDSEQPAFDSAYAMEAEAAYGDEQ